MNHPNPFIIEHPFETYFPNFKISRFFIPIRVFSPNLKTTYSKTSSNHPSSLKSLKLFLYKVSHHRRLFEPTNKQDRSFYHVHRPLSVCLRIIFINGDKDGVSRESANSHRKRERSFSKVWSEEKERAINCKVLDFSCMKGARLLRNHSVQSSVE